MKFSDYFESWLHQNYYKRGVKIGKKGDFYTSVSIGSFFGICIAKHILQICENFQICESQKIDIIEIGANEGYLLCDIIQALFTFNKNKFKIFNFNIIEPHENLRQIQKNNFYEKFGNDVKINHFSNLQNVKFENVIFISNELFDSFKCEVVDGDKMLFIENEKPVFKKIDDDEIYKFMQKFKISKGEIPLSYFEFAKQICESANNLYFITFDYGEMKPRNDFSLRIYKNHNVYNFFEIKNFSDFFGQSDITYNVNFSILKDAFESNKAKFIELKTQKRALIDFGATEILELFLQKGGKKVYNNAVLEFKHLINEFDEKFKMIKFKKGIL